MFIDGLLLDLIAAFGNNVITFFQNTAFDLRFAQVVIIIITLLAAVALSYHLYLKRSGKLNKMKIETSINVYLNII